MSRRGAVLLLAMVLPTLLAWLYLVILAQDQGAPGPTSMQAPRRNLAVMVLYGAAKVFQFSLPFINVWWFERRPLLKCSPHAPREGPHAEREDYTGPRKVVPHAEREDYTFRGLALGVAFGLVVAVATVSLYQTILVHSPGLLSNALVKIRAKVEEFGIGTPARYILFAIFLSVGHSLLEEYYWRWFVFGELRAFLPRWPAIVLSSLAFMAHHVILLGVFFPGQFWILAVPLSLAVAGGGAVWAWLYDRTGSLVAPWLSHAIIDAAILGVGYEMIFGATV